MIRHYILTRSAYGPDVPIEVNRARLEITAGVTARSMLSQTTKSLAWLVLVDPDDPLLAERRAAFASSGLYAIFAPAGALVRGDPDDVPEGPWAANIEWGGTGVLTTRIDDDDAFAPWAMASIQERQRRSSPRTRVSWTLPYGWSVTRGRTAPFRSFRNQFATLWVPGGDKATIMDVRHNNVGQLNARAVVVSDRRAYLWVRHSTARSRRNPTSQGIISRPMSKAATEIRAAFDVDWGLLDRLAPPAREVH